MYTSHLILLFETGYYAKAEFDPEGGLGAVVSALTGKNNQRIDAASGLLDQPVDFSAGGELSRISKR
jgi:hypothetical protein